MYRTIRVAVAALVWGAALFIMKPGIAAEPAAGAKVSVAYVDMVRIMSEAKPVSTLQAEFNQTRNGQRRQLNDLYAGRLLDDKERTELENLQKLAAPSAAQRNRIAALSKISDDREQELGRLMRLENPNDADRARRTQMTNWLERQNQRAMQLRTSLDQSAEKQWGDLNLRARDMILAAIRTVAQDRGIEVVVDRQAVLFGIEGRDLTEAVLQRLNGGAASAPAPPKK